MVAGTYAYQFDRAGGLAVLSFTGRVDLGLLKAGTTGMVADPAYEARWHRVVDFSDVGEVDLDGPAVDRLADFLKPLARLRRGTRLALVASAPAAQALAERFRVIRSSEGGVEVEVFATRAAAEQWALRGARRP